MKQIILNITVNDEGKPNIIINTTQTDETKIVKVIKSDALTDKDLKFFDDIKKIISENYGN